METKVNSGAIFRNDKKTKETQPDYRGRVNVDSEPYNKVVSEAQPVTGNESKINDLPF
jgi:hypothetical protein